MYSYWEKEYWYPHFDFVIVGSGIVGLSSAIKIKESFPNASIAIIERAVIPNGASTKNAGFACFGTVGELLDDLKYQTESELIAIIRMRWNGLIKLKTLVPETAMDYNNNGGYEFVRDKEEFDIYSSQLAYVNALMKEATGESDVIEFKDQNWTDGFYNKCFYNRFESSLNPAKMISFLLATAKKMGVEIINAFELENYENTGSIQLVAKNGMTLTCSNLIFCTNAFTNELLSGLDIKPARNHVLITEKIPELKYKGCYHYDKGYVYFRDVDQRLLLGGARNIDPDTEMTSEYAFNDVILQSLRQLLDRLDINKDVAIDYTWTGIIATGSSKKPIVKKIDDNIFAAVRLGGMGVAIGSALSDELIKLISWQRDVL